MTCRIKKAKNQRELDELVFNVLDSFRQQGAMEWTDWYETTSARRGKKRLGTTTFSNAVKGLMAEGRVWKDKDGCYRVAYDAVEGLEDVVANIADTAVFLPAANECSSRALLGVRNGKGDIADIAVQQLLNK